MASALAELRTATVVQLRRTQENPTSDAPGDPNSAAMVAYRATLAAW